MKNSKKNSMKVWQTHRSKCDACSAAANKTEYCKTGTKLYEAMGLFKKNVAEIKPRGSAYQLTASGSKVNLKDLGPQPQLIFTTLKKAKTLTVAEIATMIEKKIKTKQPVKKVVAFYMTEWRVRGLVRKAAK